MVLTIINIAKILTTAFLAFAAYYFLRATWNSKTNSDLIGNGFSLTFMVLAVVFMWAR